jgi:predicted nucleic acid-binding protein
MIVVDASVLLAHLNANDVHHSRAVAALLGAAEHPLAASSLTLAEVLVGPARAGQLEMAKAQLAALEIEEIPLAAGAADRLAQLRAETGLKVPDCCVRLAAVMTTADGVLTFDDRLARKAHNLGVGWPVDEVSAGSFSQAAFNARDKAS